MKTIKSLDTKMGSWSVFVMCYNEQSTIEEVVRRLNSTLEKIITDFEICVVDDGSSDESVARLEKVKSQYPKLKIFSFGENRGVGSVLRTCYERASKNYLTIVPGDLEFYPEVLETLPGIFVSRSLFCFQLSKLPPRSRRVLSMVQRVLNWILFGFWLNRVNWVKVIPKDVYQGRDFISESPLVETEVVYRAKQMSIPIIEIPGENDIRIDREGGYSKLKIIQLAVLSFFEIFQLRLRIWNQAKAKKSRAKVKVPVG